MGPSPQAPDRRPAARRLRLLAAALVLGVVVATAAVTFLAACQVVTRLALTAAAGYRPGEPAGEELLVPDTAGGPFRPWLLVPVAAAGGLVAGWLVHRLAPEAAGPGTDAVIRAYHQSDGRVRGRVAAVKILATAVTIGTGGSGGREGPMVQVGAGLGSWLAGWLGLGPADRRVLLGAGVAAVFRAPLAGALFAAEVLYRSGEFESEVLIPAGTAAVAADAVAGLALGWGRSCPPRPGARRPIPPPCVRPSRRCGDGVRESLRLCLPHHHRVVPPPPATGARQTRTRGVDGGPARGRPVLRCRPG